MFSPIIKLYCPKRGVKSGDNESKEQQKGDKSVFVVMKLHVFLVLGLIMKNYMEI